MEKLVLKKGANKLPRGGYLVVTSLGYIQFGAAPETIKDTMMLPKKVPQIFVLPGELFSVEKGIAVAELEFPIYYNHFLRGGKTYIICTEEQKKQLKVVLQESVFGPKKINLASEYKYGKEHHHFPDIEAEMKYFRGDRKLSDLVVFFTFKKKGEVESFTHKNVEIIRKEGIDFIVKDKGEEVAIIPWTLEFNVIYDIGKSLPEPFQAPEFGITCLGPSHGFDPEENTSGFILWISHRGIMVDPPVNSTEWLRRSNVNPKLISHIILTHCHADHDAGTFQKILEESQVTIHTTETIMDSFLRKYVGLTKMDKSQLYELFHFTPAMIDHPIFIEGAEFKFHYTLHSIPTIGFSLQYQNQSFYYTSDHLNDPSSLTKMNKANCFPKGRYQFLTRFPWHHKVIYHEAGIAPLHTPVAFLNSLPESVQEKVTVYHIAKKDFPENTKLKLAKFGIQNTLYPEIIPPKHADAIQILDLMENVDLFSDFPLNKAREFLAIVQEEEFKRDEKIIAKDTPGDKFFVILSGNVMVAGLDIDYKKSYGKYEYFGEASLVTGEMRAADVIAETEVKLLTIEKNAFLNFIEGTQLEETFLKLVEVRNSNSWDLLSSSKVFGSMTSHQKTQIESIMRATNIPKSSEVVKEGQVCTGAHIIKKGICRVMVNGEEVEPLGPGDFIGDIFCLLKNYSSKFSAQALTDLSVYTISNSDLTDFIQKNPGVYMKLLKARYS